MEYKPLVSIVTIVYNGEMHLEQTIQSVLQQTYPHIEYVIIDGGSKDQSVSIIKKYSDRLAYWTSEKDKGISDAFNKGIVKTTGDIIGLINADDWFELDTVEKVVKAIQGYDIAYGDLRYWKNGVKNMTVEGNHHYLINQMTLNHPTVFVKRHCYEQTGLFDLHTRYAMDYDLLLRMKLKGYKFTRVPSVLANMRWEGISDRQWLKACRELMEIKNKYMPDRRLRNRLYFWKQVLSISAGKFLQQRNLGRIVRFYRSRLSPVKKEYN